MKVRLEAIKCIIHKGILSEPVTCVKCYNNFCMDCAQKSKEKKDECPLCYSNPFIFSKNYQLKKLLFSSEEKCIECPNCKNLFNENEYSEHICNNSLIKKDVSRIETVDPSMIIQDIIGIYNDPNEPHKYLNLLKKENKGVINFEDKYSNIRKTIEVPKECYLFEKMDLYYCYRKTNINCPCCESKVCKPGNCFCKRCMIINKEYHGLKKHYLINKAGRAAKMKKNKFICNCAFINKKTKNELTFNNKCICSDIVSCSACKDLTQIKDYY